MSGIEYGPLHDLCRPYQSIWHSQSWGTLENYGKVWVSGQIHSNGAAVSRWYAWRVQHNGEFSDQIPVTNGVKQGCVLASTLFRMMFSAMLTNAFQDGDNGIPIRYRFDGKFFNLRRLQAKSKVQREVLDEFLFADDIAKGAPTEEKLQKAMDQVSDSFDSYDLTISIKKTEVVYQPAPEKPYREPTITVKGQGLQVVYKFTYFGSTLSKDVLIDDEVNARIAKASAAFGRAPCGSVWDQSGIRLDTELKLYRSVVLPTLLYACETWTVYQRHAKRLNRLHTNCLRKILKVKVRIPDKKSWKGQGCRVYILFWNWHSSDRQAMLPEWLTFAIEKPLWRTTKVVRRSDTRTTSKPPLKTSPYQQDQTKWRGLIRRDAGEYEAKRTSKAGQNILFFIQIFTITNQRMLLTDFVKYNVHTLPVKLLPNISD